MPKATKWATVGATWYDGPGGGSWGFLQNGYLHWAELGTATRGGVATGHGWVAKAFGYGGEFPPHTGAWIRYRGRTTYATKADRGYGQGGDGITSDYHYAIDLYGPLARWLHFDGKDNVEVAINLDSLPPVLAGVLEAVQTIQQTGQQTGQHALALGTGQGDFSDWSTLVHHSGANASQHGQTMHGLADKLRGHFRYGEHFHSGGNRPHVGRYIDLQLPGSKYSPPPTPHPIGQHDGGSHGSPGGSVKPGGGWLPAGSTFVLQRHDQGQDFETRIGTPLIAPGDGQCIGYLHDGPFPNGFGSPYAIVRIDTGPWASRTPYYLGHVNDVRVGNGAHFRCGEVLGYPRNSLHSGLGWVELGLAPGGVPTSWGGSASIYHLFKPTHTC